MTRKGERALQAELDRALALSARVRRVLSTALALVAVGFVLTQIASFHGASLDTNGAKPWFDAFAGLALRSAALLGLWVLRSWIPEVMAQQAWRHHRHALAAAATQESAAQRLLAR